MNVLDSKDLIQQLDQQQHDHPLGSVVAKFVDSTMKKHSSHSEKKQKRRSSTKKRQKSSSEESIKPS